MAFKSSLILVLVLTRVQKHVVLEVGEFAEAPSARLAVVGPGPVVDVHVGAEVAGGREGLLAHGALVGLLLEIKNETV